MMSTATNGRLVIVGASLAGLRAVEALREEGFSGHLTIIGDETDAPYDRSPLSKTVLTGWLPVEHTTLPRSRNVEAQWLLGVAAVGLDLSHRQVHLADGAPLARREAQVALSTLARRLVNPRLVADPPPYRENAALRGPEHLLVAFDRLLD
jgi:3-phenylpropionate/trans-cinnamate dioxygenase ferredoxin reductase component